jgi:hypothetical protein
MRYIYVDKQGFPDGESVVLDTASDEEKSYLAMRGPYTTVPIPKKLQMPRWNSETNKWKEGIEVFLNRYKTATLCAVTETADSYLSSMVPANRAELYSIKVEEAKAWTASPANPTPFIDAEISGTKESKAAIIKKIIEKNNSYWREVRRSEGLRRKVKADIEAAKTVEEVQKAQTAFLAALNKS